MELIVLLAALAVLLFVYVTQYNKLVAAKQKVIEGWAGITVQLKRRHDLIPNLVSSVETAMGHEKSIVTAILEARTAAVAAAESGDANASSSAEAALSGALRGLKMLAESNPEITATSNLAKLQDQLEETEDQIAAARRIYNSNVQAFNTRLHTIPSNFVAAIHKFEDAMMFTLPDSERATVEAVPKVQFGGG